MASYTKSVGQKLKGKAQQFKGELQQQSGSGVKGGITKMKGVVNEKVADMKMKSKTRRKRPDTDRTY